MLQGMTHWISVLHKSHRCGKGRLAEQRRPVIFGKVKDEQSRIFQVRRAGRESRRRIFQRILDFSKGKQKVVAFADPSSIPSHGSSFVGRWYRRCPVHLHTFLRFLAPSIHRLSARGGTLYLGSHFDFRFWIPTSLSEC